MTPLDKTLKRALRLDDRDYVITLTPQTLKLTVKGHKNGLELPWTSLISGESALAVALHASVGAFSNPGDERKQDPRGSPRAAQQRKPDRRKKTK